MIALCLCRRSRLYPFCDTSRRRSLPPADRRPEGDGTDGPAGDAREA
ncbi:hypothetical protein [Kitasatospora sp. NBC_00240]|nr:hypothetical protein [Kitasatospora sp. NBC_00240]